MKRSDQFIQLLENLKDVYDGGDREVVDQLEHCLQMGTRAARAGLSDRLITLSVLHDAFRVVSPWNHGEALAFAIEDRLTPEEIAILRNHSEWQHDIVHGTNNMDAFKDSPWYEDGCKFGELDGLSFDPDYWSFPLSYFVPGIRKLLDE